MPDLLGKSKPGLWQRLFGSGGSCCCGVRIVPEPDDTPQDQKDSATQPTAGQAEKETKRAES